MRVVTWLAFSVCLVGLAVPLVCLRPWPPDRLGLLPVAGIAIAPFAAVAGTAWVVRADRRAARGVVAVAALALAFGLVGWTWAASDSEGFAVLLALFVVPPAQFLVWIAGAVFTGR